MSYRVYDTPAIVVCRWPYSEANFRYLLYTRDLGRIHAQAQAVRKVGSKLQPALQIGSESTLSLVCGKSGWRVVGAASQQNFLLTISDRGRGVVDRFLRLLTYLVPDQQTDEKLYRIISAGLQAIVSSQDPTQFKVNERLLVLRSLVQLGYAPSPEAQELTPFIHGDDYSEKIISAFQPFSTRAAIQINKSLKTIQL